MGASSTYRCRVCGKGIAETLPTFPFCAERCQLLDLGGWFDETYRISRGLRPSEEVEEASPEDAAAAPDAGDDAQ